MTETTAEKMALIEKLRRISGQLDPIQCELVLQTADILVRSVLIDDPANGEPTWIWALVTGCGPDWQAGSWGTLKAPDGIPYIAESALRTVIAEAEARGYARALLDYYAVIEAGKAAITTPGPFDIAIAGSSSGDDAEAFNVARGQGREVGLREAAEGQRHEGWRLDEDDMPDAILALMPSKGDAP